MSAANKNEKGFGAVEILAVLALVVLLGLAGWRVYAAHRKTTPTTSRPPSSAQTGWRIYKSKNSSISFSYPASWRLENNSQNEKQLLESVVLDGPNGFKMWFFLENKNSLPATAVQCMIPPSSKTISASRQYEMVINTRGTLTLQNKNSDLLAYSNCGRYNEVANNLVFRFDGNYGAVVNATLNDLLNRPEIQTAEAVYASVKS